MSALEFLSRSEKMRLAVLSALLIMSIGLVGCSDEGPPSTQFPNSDTSTTPADTSVFVAPANPVEKKADQPGVATTENQFQETNKELYREIEKKVGSSNTSEKSQDLQKLNTQGDNGAEVDPAHLQDGANKKRPEH